MLNSQVLILFPSSAPIVVVVAFVSVKRSLQLIEFSSARLKQFVTNARWMTPTSFMKRRMMSPAQISNNNEKRSTEPTATKATPKATPEADIVTTAITTKAQSYVLQNLVKW